MTVVVPVYNPGPYVERCLASLLRQSLSPARYEVVLVDDGSTDGTAERLDRAAAEHPELVRVTHIPNSGWPGRPRNVGTDLARFDHVFYCDADDWLPDHALETLLDRAQADGSDLVVSRPTGNGRNVPFGVFERGDYCTTWRETPGVFSNLTVQKLFRRAFLVERGLRFHEGRVRIEDFIFMTQAYLQAERISILGSRPCYVLERREDRGNLTAVEPDEDEHFRSVERILDVVDAWTAPGAERDLALQRVLGSEIVGRISGSRHLARDDDARAQRFAQVRRLLDERVPDTADARLDPATRRRTAAVRRGDRALFEDLAGWANGLTAQAELRAAAWEAGRLRVDLGVTFLSGGQPARLERSGESLVLPVGSSDAREAGLLDATGDLAGSTAHVSLRSRDNGEEWRVPAAVTPHQSGDPSGAVALAWSVTAALDPATLAAGAPLRPGVWDLHVQMSSCGATRRLRVGATRAADVVEPLPAALGTLLVSPFWTGGGDLSVDVGQWSRSFAGELARRGVGPATVEARTFSMPLPVVLVGSPLQLEVHLHPLDRPGTAPRTLVGTASAQTGPRLVVPHRHVPRGQAWTVHLRCGGPGSGPTAATATQVSLPPRALPAPRLPGAARSSPPARQPGARSWSRRVLRLSRLVGLHVADVAAGTALVSRSTAYEVQPLLSRTFLLSKRSRRGPRVLPLGEDAVLVVEGGRPVVQPLGEQSWLVSAPSTPDAAPVATEVGTRGWLVPRPSTEPLADLRLEDQTMQHLAARHLAWLLERYDVDVVLDVGANQGQYAEALRRGGYTGHIVSFEPVPEFVATLDRLAADDDRWSVHQLALGSAEGTVPIRVQRTFSSLLAASDYGKQRFATLRDAAQDEQVVDVPLRRLDAVLDEVVAPAVRADGTPPRVFLKMDTQGFDLEVFRGLGDRVGDVLGLQSEVALLLIYEDMPRMPETVATYERAGFEISGLYPVTREPDGRIIEYDCVMVRAAALPS